MNLKELQDLRAKGASVADIVGRATNAPEPAKKHRKKPESRGHCLNCGTIRGVLICVLDQLWATLTA